MNENSHAISFWTETGDCARDAPKKKKKNVNTAVTFFHQSVGFELYAYLFFYFSLSGERFFSALS